MKSSELFGVLVRIIGLVIVLTALCQIAFAILNLIGGGPGNVGAMLLYGIPALLVGLWFLRGARALVSFAFPEDTREGQS